MEISSLIHIQLFRPESVHSGSACELVSSYSQVPILCLDSGIVSPLWFCWFKGVCMFKRNLPPALLTEWPGSFTCHWGNTRMELTPNKSEHTNLTLEKKILLLLLPGFKLTTFWSRAQHSTNKLSHARKQLHYAKSHHALGELPSSDTETRTKTSDAHVLKQKSCVNCPRWQCTYSNKTWYWSSSVCPTVP